jgi:hypothetical protein
MGQQQATKGSPHHHTAAQLKYSIARGNLRSCMETRRINPAFNICHDDFLAEVVPIVT